MNTGVSIDLGSILQERSVLTRPKNVINKVIESFRENLLLLEKHWV